MELSLRRDWHLLGQLVKVFRQQTKWSVYSALTDQVAYNPSPVSPLE
jgi:hypothetical protein